VTRDREQWPERKLVDESIALPEPMAEPWKPLYDAVGLVPHIGAFMPVSAIEFRERL